MDRYAIVLAGGEPVEPELARHLPPHPFVVAADSGVLQADVLGLDVDVLIGDMDSVGEDRLQRAVAEGVEVELHPTDKDATDLELALRRVLPTGITKVILIGGGGGRIDHLLGNALVLTSPEFEGFALEWRTRNTRLAVVRRRHVLTGDVGDVVTLLAVGGPVSGITTDGLHWELDREDLAHGSTRGVSNTIERSPVTVTAESGTLLVIHTRASEDGDPPPATTVVDNDGGFEHA